MTISVEIALIGFLVGTLIGLTGMGGGSVLTPFLILFLGIDPFVALGTGFIVGALTRSVGAWNHWNLGNIDVKVVLQLLKGSLPGILAGFGILKLIEQTKLFSLNDFLRHAIGFALVIVAVSMFFPSVWKNIQKQITTLSVHHHLRWIAPYSCFVGSLISMTSVGTGMLLVPLLIILLPASLPAVVGVNVLHGAIITGILGILHGAFGNVDWPLAGRLVVGMVPGILLGSQLSVLIPRRAFELILASTLLTTSIKLI